MVHITKSWRGVAVVVLAVVGLVAWSLSWSGDTPALDTRTVQAGAVEVRMTPRTLDSSGAEFEVEFDTHTVELSLDPAASARLTVNGKATDGATWNGQVPGGHHREGTLRFTTPVPAGATVELRITGLPQDATGTWSAP